MERLDPTIDIVFKLLLTRELALLRDMLHGILAKPILDVAVLNPDIPGDRVRDKGIVLDIRAQLDDGSRADLEMQIRAAPGQPSRFVYYGARDYADQLNRGDGYHLLTPTAVIVWSVDPMFPSLDRLHSIFELRERHTHTLFSDQLAIHLLQLAKRPTLPLAEENGYDGRVERWARFLTARDDAELDQLSAEDPIMDLAKQTLDQISQEPEARRLAREREDGIKLYRMDVLAAQAAAKAELLLKLLGLRFGSTPQPILARLGAATSEQLDAWAERVLVANTLDEVFAA